MAIGLAEIELKSHLGETLQAHLAVVDLPPNTNANCFSIADMSETGPLQTITLSLQTNPNGLQLILSSADVLLEPIINVRLSYACEPKLERDYTLLLDPAPDQGPIIQKDGLLTTTAAYAANRVAVTNRTATPLGKKHTPKDAATVKIQHGKVQSMKNYWRPTPANRAKTTPAKLCPHQLAQAANQLNQQH
jgi:Tfp pilus assembly protein FimV